MSLEARETNRVRVDETFVEQCLENGMTKEEIREKHYPALNKSQWKKALINMGLSAKRPKKVDFEIVNPRPKLEEEIADEVVTEVEPETAVPEPIPEAVDVEDDPFSETSTDLI